jgi:hypothetical protein
LLAVPEIGQLVIARKRPFVVTEIADPVAGFAEDAFRRHHLVKLSSVEDDGLGEELESGRLKVRKEQAHGDGVK